MALMASMLIQKLAECITRDGDREVDFRYMAEEGYRYEEVDNVDTMYGGPAEGGTHFVII